MWLLEILDVDIIIVIVLVFHLVSIMHASSGVGSSAARESTGNPLPPITPSVVIVVIILVVVHVVVHVFPMSRCRLAPSAP